MDITVETTSADASHAPDAAPQAAPVADRQTETEEAGVTSQATPEPPPGWREMVTRIKEASEKLKELATLVSGMTGKAWRLRSKAGADPLEVNGAIAVEFGTLGIFLLGAKGTTLFSDEQALKTAIGSRYEFESVDQTAFAEALGSGRLNPPQTMTRLSEATLEASALLGSLLSSEDEVEAWDALYREPTSPEAGAEGSE